MTSNFSFVLNKELDYIVITKEILIYATKLSIILI